MKVLQIPKNLLRRSLHIDRPLEVKDRRFHRRQTDHNNDRPNDGSDDNFDHTTVSIDDALNRPRDSRCIDEIAICNARQFVEAVESVVHDLLDQCHFVISKFGKFVVAASVR